MSTEATGDLIEGIKHHTTKVRSPRTNGFVERMNRTLLDECSPGKLVGRAAGRQEARSEKPHHFHTNHP